MNQKVIPYNFKNKIYTISNKTWYSFDNEPPPSDLLCVFYNKFLDSYRVCTYDELEEEFRFIRNNFGDIMDDTTEDAYTDYYLAHCFHPTHWTFAPIPPID